MAMAGTTDGANDMTRTLGIALLALTVGLSCAPRPGPLVPSAPGPVEAVPEPLPAGCLSRFGNARLRHPAAVTSLALTANGTLLATATATEPVVRLWDVATARLVRELRVEVEFTTHLTVVGFAPDGRRLLVVRHQSRQVNNPSHKWSEPGVLDTTTGAVSRWPWGAESAYYLPGLTITPDGKAVVGYDSGGITVWDFDTGRPLRRINPPEPGPNGLKVTGFSPDGTWIAACDGARSVYVGPLDGSLPMRGIPAGAEGRSIVTMVWHTANRLVTLWYDGQVALDPDTGRATGQKHNRGVQLTGLAPRAVAGGLVWLKDNRGQLHALDLRTLEIVPDLVVPCGWSDGPLTASADGTTLAVACGHAVRLFDAATGASRHPELDRHPADPVVRLHVSADGSRLLSAGEHAAQTWDVPSGRRLATIDWAGRHSTPHWSLSPDGRKVAGAYDAAGHLLVHDATNGAVVGRGPNGPGDQWMTSPLGFRGNDQLWVRDRGKSSLSCVELDGWRPGLAIADHQYSFFHAVSPDGRRLAASGGFALAVLATDPTGPWVEVESYRDRPGPQCGFSPPSCAIPVRFSPDGRFLVTWDHGHVVWDISAAPRRVGRLSQGSLREWHWDDVSFSPDGRRVAAVVEVETGPSSVRVWETATAAEVARFEVPGGATACAFLPDGRRMVVAHPDTTFSVWDSAAFQAR